MVLNKLCGLEKNPAPLKLTELTDPVPTVEEILVKVSASIKNKIESFPYGSERMFITGMYFVVDCLLGKFTDKTGTLTDSSGIT